MENKKCKTCKHWKNEQRDLDYTRFQGFCTNGKFEFNTQDGLLIGVYDSQNRKPDTYNQGHQFETQKNVVPYGARVPSRYCLVTEENFGCIFHTTKPKTI